MTHDPDPTPALRDPERLAALRRTALLDTPSEEAFDRLTRLAARMLDAPIALVSLVDADRQFFKSQVGLPEPWASRRETPLPYSFCQHIVGGEPLVIEDAREHPLVRDDPAVCELGVIAYAGIPLVTPDGHTLGAFCVIDIQPRAWTPEQIDSLTDLAASVMTEIDLRLAVREAEAARAAAEAAHQRQRAFMDIAPVGVLTFSPEGVRTYENREAQRILGTGEAGDGPRFRLLDEDGNPLPPERLGLVRALGGEVGEEGHLREDLIVERADGSRVWIQAHVSRVSDGGGGLLGVLIVCTDITERKRAALEREAALQALRLRERAIEEDPNGVVIADARQPDLPLIYANPAFLRITGYAAEEVLGRNCRFLQGDERDQAARETLRRAVAAGRDCRVVLRNFRKDGAPFWNALSLAPIRDAAGAVTHFVGIQADITAQKEAEDALRASTEELRASEERYRAFVRNSSEAIWRFELEQPVPVHLDEDAQIALFYEHGYLAECNDAKARSHGFERAEEILGARVNDLLDRSDPDNIAFLRAFIRSGYRLADAESEERNRQGELRRLVNNLVGFVEGDALCRVWGTQRDITEQKRAEEALRASAEDLRESEERFRSLVEATSQIVWTTDARGQVEDMPQWRAFTGQSRDAVRGWGWLEALHPDDRERIARIWWRAVEERSMYDVEYRVRAAEGAYRLFAVRGVPVLETDGTVREWVGVCSDITERRRAEEALRASTEELRQSEERFRLLVEGARDYALLMLDVDGRIMSWSAGAERVLGWAEAEVLGRDGSFFFTPEDRAADIHGQEMRTATVEGRAEDKRWHLRKDGALFFADGVMTSLRQEDGSLRGFAKVMRDATDRRRAEEEKARLLQDVQVFARREALANRIGQALRTTPDPAFVQSVAMEELGRTLGADRCYFIVYDRGRRVSRVEREWRRGEDLPPLSGEYRLSEVSIDTEALLRAGASLVADDVEQHALFARMAPMLAERRLRACVLVPFVEGETVAALTVGMADAPRAWTPDEVALVEMVATQTRSTMEAARYLQREITIAERLQEALTPTLPGRVPGLDLASHYGSALAEANVGGDFFDVFPLEKGCIALVIGDLSGKGLQAASQVATVRNMLRFALYQSGTLRKSIRALNDAITEHGLLTGFVTLMAGIYDGGDGTFTYVCCGHEPGLLYRAATGGVEELPPTGPVIGALAGSSYEAITLPIAPGDVLLLYTDGLSEAGRNRHDFLETEGLARLLVEAAREPDAETIKKRIMAAVEAHTRGAPHDDMCALIARVEGKA